MITVTVIDLDQGCVEMVVGPFVDKGAAMDWIDKEAFLRMAEDTRLIRETSDEVVLVSFEEGDLIVGNLFQVVEMEPLETADQNDSPLDAGSVG